MEIVETAGQREAVPDMFYVPAAPGGIWKSKGWYLRWIDSAPRNLRLKTLRTGPFPGYRLVHGTTVDETIKLAEEAGLNETYVNTALNRIMVGESMLAYLPIEEYERRQTARLEAYSARLGEAEDAAMASMEGRGVRPRRFEVEEFNERKAHARRGDRPRVGYTGPSAR